MRVKDLETLPGVWAKLGISPDGELCWHSLYGHAADAGAVAEALLENPVLRKRLASLAQQNELGDEVFEKIAALIALHDIGKTSLGFQRQVLKGQKVPLLKGHCSIVLGILDNNYRWSAERKVFFNALQIQLLQNTIAGGDENLLCEYLWALMAHHGSPIPEEYISRATSEGHPCWATTATDTPIQNAADVVKQVIDWYPALEIPGTLPGTPAFIHAFSGLVTLADWLASDEKLFPLDNGEWQPRIDESRRRAKVLVKQLGLTGAELRSVLQHTSLDFEDLFQKTPRPAQRTIADIDTVIPGTVVVLEAETGSGKTEAAFRHFLGLQRAGAVDGMYFALPLRTAAVQIAQRLKDDFKRIVPELAKSFPIVTAVPGYVDVDVGEASSSGYQLPTEQNSPTDNAIELPIVRRNWAADHPKKYLVSTIAVGTIDQALLSVLRVKHAHLRGSSHLRQLLVVDEVHASDVYMRELLKQLVRRHQNAGGHVLLMSATLGASARTVLLGEDEGSVSFDQAVAYPYPVLSSTDPRYRTIPLDSVTEGLPSKTVAVEQMVLGDDSSGMVTLVAKAVACGARVLIIRNRVADAVATQRALEVAGVPTLRIGELPTLHHSRFAKEDRERLDKAMIEVLGKSSSMAIAVVATQTAEQSLDIDSDFMVTDLAPADVLLQRIGRLHRHKRPNRPKEYAIPRLLLLTPPATLFSEQLAQKRPKWKNGWGSVYPNLVTLQATLDAITDAGVITVPEMNRSLVEKATHPDWLASTAAQYGSSWVAYLQQFYGKNFAERGLASTALFPWSTKFTDTQFNTRDDNVALRIATRLGEQDRLAVFDPPKPGVFDTTITQLRISAWMCRDASDDATVSDIRVANNECRFMFGPYSFKYDRFGLQVDDATDLANDGNAEAGVE